MSSGVLLGPYIICEHLRQHLTEHFRSLEPLVVVQRRAPKTGCSDQEDFNLRFLHPAAAQLEDQLHRVTELAERFHVMETGDTRTPLLFIAHRDSDYHDVEEVRYALT